MLFFNCFLLFRFIQYVADLASRYCTMSAAITGQPFMPSYRYTRLALLRNGWGMVTVDGLASATCSSCAFVVGFISGSITYAITAAAMNWNNIEHGHIWSIFAAFLSGAVAQAIFRLFATLMINVVDSL